MVSPNPVPPNRRVVERIRLRESLKDIALLTRRNADAGVGDFHLERCLVASLCELRDPNDDFTDLRELDGIPHQIGDDLAQADGVSHEAAGHIGRHVVGQLESLGVGARSQGVQGVVECVAQLEIGRFELQFARFDFREVENVIDDQQQCFGRLGDRFQVLALFRGELRVERQFGHAEYPAERGANLVAHVRHEFALRPVGRIGGFLGLSQGDLGAAALRDVAGNPERAHHVSSFVAQRELGGFDPGDPTVRPGFLLLQTQHGFPGFHQSHFVRPGLGRVFVGEKVEVGLADGGGGIGQPEPLGHHSANAQEAALLILEIDVVGQSRQQRIQQ